MQKRSDPIMKKILIPVLLCAAALLTAAEISINGDFKGSPLNSAVPKGWILSPKAPAGPTGKIIKLADGKLALSITKGSRLSSFFTLPATPFVAGDKIKLSFRASGKGKIRIGYFGYNSKPSNFANLFGAMFTITPEMKTYTVTLTGRDVAKNKLASVRVALQFEKGTDATICDIKADIQKKAAR